MKRALVILLILVLSGMLVGCRQTKDADCDANWVTVFAPWVADINARAGEYATYEDYLAAIEQVRGEVILDILNREWPSASAGSYLQECLHEDWMPVSTEGLL